MIHLISQRLLGFLAIFALLLAPLPARAQAVDVVAEPSSYDFFTVYIGDSKTMTGSVTHVDFGTIVITDYEWIYNPLGAFSVTSPISVPYPLGEFQAVDYQVTFTPPDYSFWNAILRFHTDAPLTDTVDVEFWGFGDYPLDPCDPLTSCNGICVDTDSDVNNCGACTNVCQSPEFGYATCETGVCGINCDPGYILDNGICVEDIDPCVPRTTCGEVCVDLNTDITNCGACGNVCDVPLYGSASCEDSTCGIRCGPGYVPELGICVPETEDPITLMNELLVFYNASIADDSLESTGPEVLEEVMLRFLTNALTHFEAGRVNAACVHLDVAYERTDGVAPRVDILHGPSADDLADRILDVMTVMGCDL